MTLHAHSEQDIELGALVGILDTAAHEIWTDVGVAADESVGLTPQNTNTLTAECPEIRIKPVGTRRVVSGGDDR